LKLALENQDYLDTIMKKLDEIATTANQPMGNLKQRALDLANDILDDLYLHGWKEGLPEAANVLAKNNRPEIVPMPTNGPDKLLWQQHRSEWFCGDQFDRATKIQQEFASIHRADSRLDYAMHECSPTFLQVHPMSPQSIEEVGKGLDRLANQIN
jgi:hypothetical protein